MAAPPIPEIRGPAGGVKPPSKLTTQASDAGPGTRRSGASSCLAPSGLRRQDGCRVADVRQAVRAERATIGSISARPKLTPVTHRPRQAL
jgi:hypothetical protein